MANHHRVIHSEFEFANPLTGTDANTARAVISQVQRALVGVYHDLGGKHLHRSRNEIVWRWNHRDPGATSGQALDHAEGRCEGEIHDDLEAIVAPIMQRELPKSKDEGGQCRHCRGVGGHPACRRSRE
jgi:hypothetical protein